MKKFYFGLITLLLTLFAAPSLAQDDYSVSLPTGYVLSIGNKADFLTATTGGSDNDNWYLITQKRVQSGTDTQTPVYDNGSSTLYRADTDVTPASLNGGAPEDNAKYLVRFYKVGEAYNIQFATGNFIQTTLVTGDQSTAGQYLLYNINGEATHIGWNLTEDGTTYGSIVDNNGAGYSLAFWDSGQVTYTDGNNDWCVYPVSFISESDLCTATINYSYKMGDETMYTYTKTQTGAKSGFEVAFDAPAERYGVTCSDETPSAKTVKDEDAEFNITYYYTKDESVTLPFETTTVDAEGKYAEGTKWYYINTNIASTNYAYSNDDDEYIYYDSRSTHPINLHYMFCFTGNPITGYRIHNYKKSGLTSVDGSETCQFTTDGAEYLLKEGYYYSGYCFNLSTGADSYLNAYDGQLTIYTWGSNWAYADGGSQYDIIEVTDKELAQAIAGVMSFSASPESGNVWTEGEALDAVAIIFSDATSATSVVIAEGMEEGKITLTDGNGNVVATPTYSINEDDPAEAELDIIFDPAFNTPGKYYLNIPEGLVKDNVSGLPNQSDILTYSFQAPFEGYTVTARIWKSFTNDIREYPCWQYDFPYATHADGEYYTCKVNVKSQNEIELIDWEGSGDETDVLNFKFDPTVEITTSSTHNGLTVNDATVSSDGSSWIDTDVLYDDGYYGAYFYPTYSNGRLEDNYGQAQIEFFSYADWKYEYICADWYVDDRYSYETIQGVIYNRAFKDLQYDYDNYTPFSQLPYTGEGTYNVYVDVKADTMIVRKYDGINDIKLTVKDGGVTQVNDADPDDYNTIWVKSSVLDGESNGWYCYAGEYNSQVLSPATYDATNNSGYIVLQGYDYSISDEGGYRYIYIGLGDYTPELDGPEPTAISEVAGSKTQTAVKAIYNIAGQKLNKVQKGLNIIDGKKVVY